MILKRFLKAQEIDYEIAKNELLNGKKQSHWIWYIFPQLKGLGMSFNSEYYGIKDIREAEDYYYHIILGARLLELTNILLELNVDDISEVMPFPDDLKLKSSMTLFYKASHNEIFKEVINKYFDGEFDEKTLNLLKEMDN